MLSDNMKKLKSNKKYAGFLVAVLLLSTMFATVNANDEGSDGWGDLEPFNDLDIYITILGTQYNLMDLLDWSDHPLSQLLDILYGLTDRRSVVFLMKDYNNLNDPDDDYGIYFYYLLFADTDNSHCINFEGSYAAQYPYQDVVSYELPENIQQVDWLVSSTEYNFFVPWRIPHAMPVQMGPVYCDWIRYDIEYYEDGEFIRTIDQTFKFNKNIDDVHELFSHAHADGPYYKQVNHTILFGGSKSNILNEEIINYTWDFGDGNTGYGINVNHGYRATGRYLVKLTITGDQGSVYSDATTAYVYDITFNEDDDENTCFLAGTSITMADGTQKNIEDVTINELVKAYNLDTDNILSASVTETHHHSPEEMGDYYTNINEKICVTPNHRLSVFGKLTYADYVRPFDVIYGLPGSCVLVSSTEKTYEQVSTYHLEVNDQNIMYAVSGGAALGSVMKIPPIVPTPNQVSVQSSSSTSFMENKFQME